MGMGIRFITQRYTFLITATSIYFKTNDALGQKFQIISQDGTALTKQCHLELLDSIYRKRIKDTAALNDIILSKYRLESTLKKI